MNTISKQVNAFTISAILLLSSTSVFAENNSAQCQQNTGVIEQQLFQQKLLRNIEQLAQQKIDLQIEHRREQFAQQQERQMDAWQAKNISKQTNFERSIQSQPADTIKIKLATK